MILTSFLKYWFWEGPIAILLFFKSLNRAFLELISLPLIIKTFFKPLKNEYRKGLIIFSIVAGVFIKTILLIVDIILIFYLLIFEIIFLISFLALPFLALYFLVLYLT